MLDHFQMGPNLVRGFAPAGIGPRDLASPSQDALGGSMYWGASVEAQSPIPYVPRDVGLKVAAFADAGSLWDYKGPTFWAVTGEKVSSCFGATCPIDQSMQVRASVGAGLIWNSPFGPLRFDYAIPLLKEVRTEFNGSGSAAEPSSRASRKVGTGFPPARSLGTKHHFGLMLRRAKAGRKRSCSDKKVSDKSDSA